MFQTCSHRLASKTSHLIDFKRAGRQCAGCLVGTISLVSYSLFQSRIIFSLQLGQQSQTVFEKYSMLTFLTRHATATGFHITETITIQNPSTIAEVLYLDDGGTVVNKKKKCKRSKATH